MPSQILIKGFTFPSASDQALGLCMHGDMIREEQDIEDTEDIN